MRNLLPILFGVIILGLLFSKAHAQTPVISGTLSVSLTGDNNANGQVNPGDQLSYTAVITNSGSGSAASVNLTMPAPANTTLVTSSLRTSALARPDAYTALISGTLSGTTVLTNDFGLPTKTVLSFGPSASPANVVANGSTSSLTDQGGNVVVNTNGTFAYTPTGSFVGYDKFGYTATTTTLPNDAATVTIGVGTPVTAFANSYNITGNITNTQVAPGVLGNDNGDQKVVTAVNGSTANVGIAVTTTQSGTVTLQANGGFVYAPPAGYTGTDSFTYTANNGLNLPSSAVVTLTIQDMIWFVNNAAPAVGTGTLAKPFNTLASFQAVNNGAGNNPATGDNIFVYSGSGNYTGGITLLANQKLIGQGATASLTSVAGITPATGSASLPATSGTDPTITNSSGNGVSLGSGNTVRGLTIGTSSATALAGSGFGALTVGDLTINTTGQGLALNNGAINGSFDGVTSTGGANNISLTAVTGSVAINAGSLSGATTSSFSITGGSVSVTYSGNLSQANNAPMVNVAGGHTGTLTFQTGTLNATNGTGLQFDNADGSYNFNGTTTLNGGNAGVDIINGSGGTFSFLNTTITNPSGIAYREDTSTPTVTFNGTITQTGSANVAVDINAKTGGRTTFTGGITTSTTTANAIDLTGNTSSTVTFGGNNLAITTTTGIGFNATGGGTVNVTGTGNTISSPSATALNVVTTTIGASGLTFQSISSGNGTAAPDPANGIVLNNTGLNGGLAVTGSGSTNASGGTIQNITNRGVSIQSASTISLKNMQFTSANLTDASPCGAADNSGCNAAIYLNTVTNVTLDNVDISGTTSQQGINAKEVSGLQLLNSTIANAGTGGQGEEGGLYALDLFGNSVITNTSITFPGGRGVTIYNTSKTLSLSVAGSIFSDTQTSGVGADAFEMSAFGTSTTTLNIINSSFLRSKTNGIQFIGSGNSISSVNITNSILDYGNYVGGGGALDLDTDTNGSLQFNFNNNTCKGALTSIVNFYADGNSSLEGRCNNNTVTSGGGSGSGIRVLEQGTSKTIIEIKGNIISGITADNGIDVTSRAGNYNAATERARLDAIIDGNTVTVGSTANAYIRTAAGQSGSTFSSKTCAWVKNNNTAGGGPGFATFEGRVVNAHELILQGGGGTMAANWNNNTNSPASPPAVMNPLVSGAGSITFSGSCKAPTNPLP